MKFISKCRYPSSRTSVEARRHIFMKHQLCGFSIPILYWNIFMKHQLYGFSILILCRNILILSWNITIYTSSRIPLTNRSSYRWMMTLSITRHDSIKPAGLVPGVAKFVWIQLTTCKWWNNRWIDLNDVIVLRNAWLDWSYYCFSKSWNLSV